MHFVTQYTAFNKAVFTFRMYFSFHITHILKLLTNLLGRYARVVDHLAVRDVAQGAPLGGVSNLHPSWEHIFTALEFVPTPTACCAASTKPWTETILDDVLHYPVGQSVSDTGRPGQK